MVEATVELVPDDFVVTAETLYAEGQRWVNRVMVETVARFNPKKPNEKIAIPPAGQELIAAASATRTEMLLALSPRLLRLAERTRHPGLVLPESLRCRDSHSRQYMVYYAIDRALGSLLKDLVSHALPLSIDQIQALIADLTAWVAFDLKYGRTHLLKNHVPALTGFLTRFSVVMELGPEVRPQLEALHDLPLPTELIGFINKIFGYESWSVMQPGAPWANTILRELSTLAPDVRQVWLELLRHGRTQDRKKPTKKWLKEADRLRNQLPPAEFKERLFRWINQFKAPPFSRSQDSSYVQGLLCMTLLLVQNGDTEETSVLDLCRFLEGRATTLSTYQMENSQSTCYTLLSLLPGREPLLALARLQRNGGSLSSTTLSWLIATVSEQQGLTPYDLDDLTVPTCGLDAQGCLSQKVGPATAVVSFAADKPLWSWIGANGKPRKTVPPEVKSEHKQELERVKELVSAIQQVREEQETRHEGLYRTTHSWCLSDWQERYPTHGLLRNFAHRLLWQLTIVGTDGEISSHSALWREGRFEDVAGNPLTFSANAVDGEAQEQTSSVASSVTSSVRVELWHPVASDVETVLAWRARLDALGIVQPFKQAYREAYLLTDAERASNFYSNRFAAHIIRQFVFHRHCKRLGWQNRLRIVNGSSDKRAVFPLPDWGLQAEFWVETVDDPRILEGSVETYNYLSTDQVRFRKQRQRRKPGEPPQTDPHQDAVRIADVHPRLFWEIMRDVDAMVARASIANDPTWQDRGIMLSSGASGEGNNRYAYMGVELGLPERRAMLEKLLPRLNIASRCTLTDIFLVVRGDVRTYKIHLGSGNILMEPNDQYLCIIRSRGGTGEPNVHPAALSFEGDSTLSLILSKAVLLASDSTVTDPVILQQIHPRIYQGRAIREDL